MKEKIAVLGLGYVGLPLAVGLAEAKLDVVGFDVNRKRIQTLSQFHDWTEEVEQDRLRAADLKITDKAEDIKDSTVFIACVPTPINDNKLPDLTPLEKVCGVIGPLLKKGDIVVFESTVYPGVTEDICGVWLEELSNLKSGVDFKLGYSPERINPGDKVNRLENINKIVAAQDKDSLARLEKIYKAVVTQADLHLASNIKVGEMAKVIENTQRDLNIAFMNEIAFICDHMGIRTTDVLKAAGTKWNFLKFKPGLVGGHCIGVDPYYLTTKAELMGYQPNLILESRRINDRVAIFIANKAVKMQIDNDRNVKNMKVGILGITFKENVNDIRNSKIPDIMKELRSFSAHCLVYDPLANKEEAHEEYGIDLCEMSDLKDLDVLIYAVDHDAFKTIDLGSLLKKPGSIIDVKSTIPENKIPKGVSYWSL